MKPDAVIPLAKMTDAMLRELAEAVGRRHNLSPDVEKWPRVKLVRYIEGFQPIPKTRKKANPSVNRVAGCPGVARFCRDLLRRVVGDNNEGMPYGDVVTAARAAFPSSQISAHQVRCYAHWMRNAGEDIPVNRRRSTWQK